MFGLEAIFRNGVPVGHLRRSDYGFFIDKTIGYGYIRNPDGGVVKTLNTHTHCVAFITLFDCSVFHLFSYVFWAVKKFSLKKMFCLPRHINPNFSTFFWVLSRNVH